MALPGIDETRLFELLNQELSASHPITSPEHLFGRELALERIHGALAMNGRQIFIYGDRGVGKTSLAQTAAFRYQSSDSQPVITGCLEHSTLSSVMQDILIKLRKLSPYAGKRVSQEKRTASGSLAAHGLSVSGGRESSIQLEETLQPVEIDANTAVMLLQHEAGQHSKAPVVVIDEFDRMATAQRAYFADFMKQAGDQRVPVKFIFCGIADTLDDLLDAHASTHRYLEGIKIDRLHVQSRWEIIDKSAEALGVTVEDDVRRRIAAISDGFPYYVHLICEKLYQILFHADDIVESATAAHMHEAINQTIQSIEHAIRRPYDRVVQREDGKILERVLWALADHEDLIRTQKSIFQSHQQILSRQQLSEISEKDFTRLMAKLRTSQLDVVRLHKGRRGLNEFCENMFRGYVRLRAESQGIQLATDYAAAPDPRSAFGPRTAQGVSPLYQFPSYGKPGRSGS